MNIDNNLGTALYSSDLSGAAATGELQSMVNGASGNPKGSLFQQLISQVLTTKNAMTEAAGENVSGGAQNKSGGTGDLLSELLLAGGNLAKIRLQNAGKVICESVETKGQSGESAATDENSEPMEAIQALMAGLVNAVPIVNSERAIPKIQNGKATVEAPISAIGSVQTDGSNLGVLASQKYIPNTQNASMEERKTIVQDGKPVLNETNPVLNETNPVLMAGVTTQTDAAVLSGGEKPAGLKDVGFLETAKPVMLNGKAENQDVISGQGFKTPEIGSDKQTAAAGSQIQEGIAASAEKQENETDGTAPDKIEFQNNSVQGAVTTSEATGPNPLTQSVESAEPYSQIRKEILSKLEQKGPTEFQMQLEPEDLGQIDIKLKLSEGKLVIDILAANSKTQALLTSQVDKLISSMGLQNVQIESVQVNQQMNSQTQDNSQSQGYTMSSGMDFSQRKQQEHCQQEFLNGSKLAGTFGLQPDETQTSSPVNRIETFRNDSHRMNYSV
ncbi:MAG TPA: flagellar hook-length control protein FliK [Anaerovoracaceae bacterium]|nr:flagellar hook-length control protein FliK [Anaerovoracaceae bacterium]